jgi:hypothetical protein
MDETQLPDDCLLSTKKHVEKLSAKHLVTLIDELEKDLEDEREKEMVDSAELNSSLIQDSRDISVKEHLPFPDDVRKSLESLRALASEFSRQYNALVTDISQEDVDELSQQEPQRDLCCERETIDLTSEQETPHISTRDGASVTCFQSEMGSRPKDFADQQLCKKKRSRSPPAIISVEPDDRPVVPTTRMKKFPPPSKGTFESDFDLNGPVSFRCVKLTFFSSKS